MDGELMVKSESAARAPRTARDARRTAEKTVANILVGTVQESGRVRELRSSGLKGQRREGGGGEARREWLR